MCFKLCSPHLLMTGARVDLVDMAANLASSMDASPCLMEFFVQASLTPKMRVRLALGLGNKEASDLRNSERTTLKFYQDTFDHDN